MNLIRHSAARDLRVDFFRGLALWWIYTDHIPGDVLGDFSLRNFGNCSPCPDQRFPVSLV